MEDNIYLSGNTIRLTATFRDINDNLVDPSSIKVILYNYRYEKINEIPIGTSSKLGVGEYFYDYKTPMEEQRIIYEWYGEIEGNTALQRGSFQTKFII